MALQQVALEIVEVLLVNEAVDVLLFHVQLTSFLHDLGDLDEVFFIAPDVLWSTVGPDP